MIMSVYNGDRFVGETIRSILDQTFDNFELIIVNDASIDHTRAIIEGFQVMDHRIRLINNDINRERAVSRNIAIGEARGEYIALSDADDISQPTRLERQVEFLDQNISIGLVGTGFVQIDDLGNETNSFEPPLGATKDIVHFLCNPSVMFRKSCLEGAGCFREALVPAEDYDLCLRIADKYKIGTIKSPLYKYRVHGDSSSSKQAAEMKIAACLAVELSEKRRKAGNDPLNSLDREEALALVGKRRCASRSKKKRALSQLYTVWAGAAYGIGNYRKMQKYTFDALKVDPWNKKAWPLVVKLSFIWYGHSITEKLYPSIAGVRRRYWDHRAQLIDDTWGQDDHDYGIIWNVLSEVNPKTLLDIGCGGGRLFPVFARFGVHEIVGQDIARQSLEIARKKYPSTRVKITSSPISGLNYGLDYFDLIISNRVLQHIPDNEIEGMIQAVARMGKHFYVNEMTDSDDVSKTFYMFKHDYPSLLAEHGFHIQQRGMIGNQTWFLFRKISRND